MNIPGCHEKLPSVCGNIGDSSAGGSAGLSPPGLSRTAPRLSPRYRCRYRGRAPSAAATARCRAAQPARDSAGRARPALTSGGSPGRVPPDVSEGSGGARRGRGSPGARRLPGHRNFCGGCRGGHPSPRGGTAFPEPSPSSRRHGRSRLLSCPTYLPAAAVPAGAKGLASPAVRAAPPPPAESSSLGSPLLCRSPGLHHPPFIAERAALVFTLAASPWLMSCY